MRSTREGGTVAAVKEEGLGFKFWIKLAGIVALCGIAAMILFLLLSRAVYAWGFLGGFLAFALLLILVGWIWDRRNAREWDTE